MQGDKSKKMNSERKSPKKLRKILPRPRNPEVVIITPDAKSREPPKLRTLLPQNTPPPLVTKSIKNKEDSTLQKLPNVLPVNNSLPPLAVINQKGVKILKAVWVPNTTVASDIAIQEGMQINTMTPSKGISFKDFERSLCKDEELCCRLCGERFTSRTKLVDVFGSEGRIAKLQEKVRQCLPISIKESDKLPSTVCRECLSVLDLSFKLVITALKTDQELRGQLLLKEKINENVKERDINPAKIPNQTDRDTLDICAEDADNQTDLVPGHPNFDHTYILRESRKETAERSTDAAALADKTKCNFCEETYGDIETLLQHVKSEHADVSSLGSGERGNTIDTTAGKDDADDGLSDVSLMHCFKCQEVCLDDEDLQFHLNYECVVCDVCGQKARSRRAYVIHLKNHHEVTFEEIQQRRDKNQVKDSEKEEEQISKRKDAEEETENFDDNRLGSDDEGETSIREEQEYECPVCHKIYSTFCNFEKHSKLHDPLRLDRDEKFFKCDACPRVYNRRVNLVKHQRTHHQPSSSSEFACMYCDEKFESRKERLQHERNMHSVEFKESEISASKDGRHWICGHCGKAMATKLSLAEHERIHTGAKPCTCEYCGRTFRTKTNLNQHVVVHTRDRTHLCPLCGKGFSRKSFVTQHLRVHTGEKPFVCEICGKQFSQSGDMSRHRKKHGELKIVEVPAKIQKLDESNSEQVRDAVEEKLEEMFNAVSPSHHPSDLIEEVVMDDLTCEICLLEFQDRDELRDHQLFEHGQEYQEIEELMEVEDEVKDELEEEEITEYVLVVPS